MKLGRHLKNTEQTFYLKIDQKKNNIALLIMNIKNEN